MAVRWAVQVPDPRTNVADLIVNSRGLAGSEKQRMGYLIQARTTSMPLAYSIKLSSKTMPASWARSKN